MSILLIRHGETALNVARTLQPADTPLGPRGIAQAEALAQRLTSFGIGAILSSDLPRAWRTAQAIASTTGAPIQASALLHERNFGDLRGLAYDTLGFNPLVMEAAPPGGESAAEFSARVDAAFDAAVAMAATVSGHLAVVTHGLVIRDLVRRRLALATGMAVPATIRNTSVTVCGALPPHAIDQLDNIDHLDERLGGDAPMS